MAGIDAFGITFEIDIGDDDFVTALEVGEVTDADFLDISVEDIDVTSHASPDQWREFLGGLKDGGALTFTVNFDPALHGDILDELGVNHDMRFTFPPDADDATIVFPGYLSGFTGSAPVDDKLEAEASVKVAGKPELTIP